MRKICFITFLQILNCQLIEANFIIKEGMCKAFSINLVVLKYFYGILDVSWTLLLQSDTLSSVFFSVYSSLPFKLFK